MERDRVLLAKLEAIRAAAAVQMGIATSTEEATKRSPSNPKLVIVAPAQDAPTVSGTGIRADAVDVTVRIMSMGRPHRAVALTAAMCTAVAARIEGTIVHGMARPPRSPEADLRIGHPSGTIDLAAAVRGGNERHAEKVVVYRTARRLMDGSVFIPESRLVRHELKSAR
jgi:2-methylaconitate cis-trans-isomerase PrpF